MKAKFGMLERNYNPIVDTTGIAERVKKPEHMALVQEMADQSMTLMDNKLGIVPLDMTKKIAYVAYNAKHIPMHREYGDIEGLSGYNPETGMVDSTTLMYQHLLKNGKLAGGNGEVHYFALDKKSNAKEIALVEKQLKEYYDVAIIGGGIGGLFTAYKLKEKDPHLNIAIFEQGAELELSLIHI